ncbi:hypothetical protein [Bailinhaonella thermotolerans]|uniref:Uncharacterized protein n=1 Tax=Bailinhaonella thermotolerans TaxID=1070861 RepID=A0A3A4B553_9ACTN|nr:hypothetical protein [Bailinhaonella thermotolerans]RJL35740.1 hypothetical protein D5H75_02860 [Bailinhaonella thermotolerans]
MRRWFRSYWDEEDIWFYFEVDADGWVARQVELQGAAGTPIAAASLAEWRHARDAGAGRAYEATYGFTAEVPVHEWEGHDPEPLTRDEFDAVWRRARGHLRDHRAGS